MLNDIARFREAEERKQKRTIPESVVASRWRQEVFEPTVAAVPEELWAALPAAEVFHQVLEHRWFLSERAAKDVGIDEAVRSYVEGELPTRRPERVVLEPPDPTRGRAGGATPPAHRSRAASLRGTPQRATLDDGRLAGAHRDPPCTFGPGNRLRGEDGDVMDRVRGHCTSFHVWEATPARGRSIIGRADEP